MELPKFIKIVLGLISALMIINVLLLDIFFVKQRSDILDAQSRISQLATDFQTLGTRIISADLKLPTTTLPVSPSQNPVQEIIDANTCPQSCVSLINQAKAVAPSTSTVVSQTSTKGEYFIQMGTGSLNPVDGTSSNWKTIDSAQATFDTANYGNVKSATIEVFMHVATSGEVHARLFDSTTPTLFWGNDMLTQSLSSVLVSQPITLTAGTKTYKIQMYTTLSTGYLDQARVHIVTQ